MSSLDITTNALEAGRKLFAQECRFLLGVAKEEQLPASGRPEIGFAGCESILIVHARAPPNGRDLATR